MVDARYPGARQASAPNRESSPQLEPLTLVTSAREGKDAGDDSGRRSTTTRTTSTIHADPYPVFRRLREEAPLYFNERYGFYALSRFERRRTGARDHETFSSAQGGILEMIKADIRCRRASSSSRTLPCTRRHRGLLSRVFTPKKMGALEPQIREYCAARARPPGRPRALRLRRRLGAEMPMRGDRHAARHPRAGSGRRSATRATPGCAASRQAEGLRGPQRRGRRFFAEYLDWRAEQPSDDLMTELLQAEFEDPDTGTVRRLTREEILTFVNILATAGNETTNRLIGWTGKLLADHPDQRRELRRPRR